MGQIYTNAACTIAATASKDSKGGLFHYRHPELLRTRLPFNFNPQAPWLEGKGTEFALTGTYLCDVWHLAGICIENAPLNSRAWVSQERQLSRRILHFARTQLFWECHEYTACETYPEGLPDWAQPAWGQDAKSLKRDLHTVTHLHRNDLPASLSSSTLAQGLDAATFFAWVTYRIHYSRSALTYSTDKLVAIRGVADLVSQTTGDELVAGLWRSHIIEELCWSVGHPTASLSEWRAPTWSWASSDSTIQPSLLTTFHAAHSDQHIAVKLDELDVRTKASGELEYASMKLQCRPLHVKFTLAAALEEPDRDIHGVLQLTNHAGVELVCGLRSRGLAPEIWFNIDHGDTSISDIQYGYVVIVQLCLHEETLMRTNDDGASDAKECCEDSDDESEGSTRDCLEALFLRTHGEDGEGFERVGLIRFGHWRAIKPVLDAHRMAEQTVITLF